MCDIVKKVLLGMLLGLCLVGLTACEEESVPEGSRPIYYVSNAETKVEVHYHVMRGTTTEEQIEELLNCLATNPEKLEYKAPLNMGFGVISAQLVDGIFQMDVDAAYKKLAPTTEVLVRAAVVRTLTQLDNIRYVLMTVEGEKLYDNSGSIVGRMNASNFIANDGNAINTHELAKVQLYFANEDGSKLISTYLERHYPTSISLERLVVEALIAGPVEEMEGRYPSVNPNTKIINVITKDGICYVNLDQSFLTVVNNVSTEVSVYSIVNSLVELNNVSKVQVLINGEVPTSFSNKIYERNWDLVGTLKK